MASHEFQVVSGQLQGLLNMYNKIGWHTVRDGHKIAMLPLHSSVAGCQEMHG